MKIEKKKIVFGSVLLLIIVFIVAYSALTFGNRPEASQELKAPLVPALEEEPKVYESKLDAVNDIEEVRESNAPSIYNEKFLDSSGYYDPDLAEKEKDRLLDSIYNSSQSSYNQNISPEKGPEPQEVILKPATDPIAHEEPTSVSAKELGLEHQLFFSSNGVNKITPATTNTDKVIYVEVDGKQKVKANYRLRMRLTKDAMVGGVLIPKNTPVYGFVSFQPNRVMIEIENIKHHPVELKAYDLQDGSEGIYVVNSFRAEASRQIIDDVIQDINIPSVPQLGGLKNLFRRSNRNIKVTISNNYQLLLKP